jgi:hypothetical protein
MKRLPVVAFFLVVAAIPAAEDAPKRTPKEALQAFNDLVGAWHGNGEPNGSREEKQKGFWQENIAWQWQFKGDDCWLAATIEKGKYFTAAELRYLPDNGHYRLTLHTTAKDELVLEGELKDKRFTASRTDEKTKETQQVVVSLLHRNRYLYRYEVKPAEKTVFAVQYQVGATKEGAAFATVDEGPECVVSGGLGTFTTTYKGKTYYFCCTGCRDAFKETPDKYIKEFEERQAAKAKERAKDDDK